MNAFSLYPARMRPESHEAIRSFVRERTDSEAETDSITRSIERYGVDGSIEYFEITPAPNRLGLRTSRAAAWTVRAVRFDSVPISQLEETQW